MTTAIALESSKGEFAFGLALGVILLVVSFRSICFDCGAGEIRA